MADLIPVERIESRILVIREKKVMLDSDLAELYEVETGALVRAVKRNIERFPDEFMFQLDSKEFARLKCQIGIANSGRGGRRTPPYAFTEQGVAMLSSVLRSKKAIQINIVIMKTFVKMREMIAENAEIAAKLKEIETRMDDTDMSLAAIMMVLRQLQQDKKPKKIGFDPN